MALALPDDVDVPDSSFALEAQVGGGKYCTQHEAEDDVINVSHMQREI